jgi:hypothetical protein
MRLPRRPGSGLRAASRSTSTLLGGLLLAAVIGACDGPAGPGPAGPSDAVDGSSAPGGAVGGTDTSGPPGSVEATTLERIGGLELDVAPLAVPEALDVEGGAELAAMLAELDLAPAEVGLTVAVDPGGRLAIGHWQLPGADAGRILDAWARAAGGWSSETLAGRPALAGRGPDDGLAWAAAADGVFLYVSTDDRALAEAAVAALGGE